MGRILILPVGHREFAPRFLSASAEPLPAGQRIVSDETCSSKLVIAATKLQLIEAVAITFWNGSIRSFVLAASGRLGKYKHIYDLAQLFQAGIRSFGHRRVSPRIILGSSELRPSWICTAFAGGQPVRATAANDGCVHTGIPLNFAQHHLIEFSDVGYWFDLLQVHILASDGRVHSFCVPVVATIFLSVEAILVHARFSSLWQLVDP